MTRRNTDPAPKPEISEEEWQLIFGDGPGPSDVRSDPQTPQLEDPSVELYRAMEGDRESALELWREVAQGRIDDEHLAWFRWVARAILDADTEPAKTRPAALVRAIGLEGKTDRWRRMREVAAALRDFGASHEAILSDLEARGLLDSDVVDARSLLARELAKEPRPD